MKGCYFLGNRKFEVREQVLPELGENDILVRNMVCGVCGSDVHTYYGEATSTNVKLPVILGHEFSGKVEQIGAAVTTIKPGDKVTIDPNIYCGYCLPCRNGKKQLCDNLGAIGVNRDGGFGDYCVVPEKQAFVLNPDMDYEVAAMSEPLACCIHGIDLAEIRCGQDVLVIGGGAIGLMMVQLAKLAGAARVILSEPVAHRRKIGEQLGADASFDPKTGDPAKQLSAIIGREGVDVVIECVGNMVATRQSFECAAKGATILLFSVPPEGETFPMAQHEIFKKELTIRGSMVNPDTHQRAVQLLSTGRINVKPIISHRFGIADTEKAIMTQMSNESIKVIVCTDL